MFRVTPLWVKFELVETSASKAVSRPGSIGLIYCNVSWRSREKGLTGRHRVGYQHLWCNGVHNVYCNNYVATYIYILCIIYKVYASIHKYIILSFVKNYTANTLKLSRNQAIKESMIYFSFFVTIKHGEVVIIAIWWDTPIFCLI